MAASNADSTRQIAEKAVEVVSWDPADHTDLPGFAHGLTRFGAHWMDVGISVIPVDVDPLQALDKVFERCAKLSPGTRPKLSFSPLTYGWHCILRSAAGDAASHCHAAGW